MVVDIFMSYAMDVLRSNAYNILYIFYTDMPEVNNWSFLFGFIGNVLSYEITWFIHGI